MLRYTLRQVEYLVAAVEHASIAKAAEALNVSQPSVSAAIAKLEDQLGAQLLIRQHAQGVIATPAGARLLAAARNLLAHADELQRRARVEGSEVTGTLSVSSFLTLAPVHLPAILSGFRTLNPDVEVVLGEGTQDSLVEDLRAGRCELALLYDLDLPPDVAASSLAAFSPYALLPARHPLAARDSVSLVELAREPMILLSVPPSERYFRSLFQAQGLQPHVAYASPSLELVRGLVGRGVGYSILVTRPKGDLTYEGEPVAARPIVEPCRTSDIALARLRDLRPTRAMRAFEDFCVAYFRRLKTGSA
jgi:DNA-binding transcriptional LysR family regulator